MDVGIDMDFKERLARKKAAKKKTKKKKVESGVVKVSTGRKCGKCGQAGHNARTCGVSKPPTSIKKSPKARVSVKSQKTIETPKTLESGESNLGNRDWLQPPIKDVLNELKELLEHKEISKPSRDDIIFLEEYSKKRSPSKLLVMELKSKLDPKDLVNERYTVKKNLRDRGFRVPSTITTTELIQLAIKREVL